MRAPPDRNEHHADVIRVRHMVNLRNAFLLQPVVNLSLQGPEVVTHEYFHFHLATIPLKRLIPQPRFYGHLQRGKWHLVASKPDGPAYSRQETLASLLDAVIAHDLSNAGWSWGWVSALDRDGRIAPRDVVLGLRALLDGTR